RAPSGRPVRLPTSSAPVLVSSFTVTNPAGLNARTYATASALSTVCSISSNGMPTSAQSAVSASPRLSVDGSEGDREPARDNVIPCDMNDYRCSPASTEGLYCDACLVDRDQLAFHDRLRLSCAIPHIHPCAAEPLVLTVVAEGTFG